MRDDFYNNQNDYENTNNGKNREETDREIGSVNFELVDSIVKEGESLEQKKQESDFNSQTTYRTNKPQYHAANYGYESGQGTTRTSSYQQNNSYNGTDTYFTYGKSDNGTSDYNNSNYYNSSYNSSNYNFSDDNNGKKKKDSFPKKLLKTVTLAAVFGLVASATFQGGNLIGDKLFGVEANVSNETEHTGEREQIEDKKEPLSVTQTNKEGTFPVATDVSNLVENTMPSMVAITSTIVENYSYFGRTFSQEADGSGSGIIVGKNDNQLLIVTNNHVIDGAKTISVCFIDKEIVQAEVKGTDPASDLAVVAIDMDTIKDSTKTLIKVATLGSSEDVKLGQMAVAIGNALGYGQSVTVGYISAKDRNITVGSGSSATTMNLLQTDAAINPGNSGGALLNLKGEVIGINSAKLADTDVEGMGYAIPITEAIPIINELMNREVLEESEKGYLGITGQDITEENNIYNMPTGVYVYEVAEEGAAKEAGMQQGDIIVKINGNTVKNMEAVQNKVNNTKVGTKITVTVMRNINGTYQEVELEVTLKGYASLNSLQEEEKEQEQNSQAPNNQYPNNGWDYYKEDDASRFFKEFFGDFGF